MQFAATHSSTGRLAVAIAVGAILAQIAVSHQAQAGDDPLKKFSLPPGFTIEVAAAAPQVLHPMMAALDDRGRLFVAESAGVNQTAKELLAKPPHKILLLEDANGDGRYEKSTVFADGLIEPNGAAWYDGALYVCSAPYLWRFEDTDGDGRADRRQRILGKFNFNGMSDAFHGPVLGPDGRLYFCGGQHGWSLLEVIADRDRNTPPPGFDTERFSGDMLAGPWTSTAPGVFACWPDGSGAEPIAHGGICNPVEVAFMPDGQPLGSVAVFDMLDGRHDALLHWIEGGVFNMRETNYPKVITTGDLLPPLSRRGHVAPSGVMRYRGAQFGEGFSDNLLLTEFNTHKVFRIAMKPSGATLAAEDHAFLSTEDTDVHFTDVLEDADSSLLVIDTGGWFLRGCPTSQIEKPQLLGTIYRIRRTGGARPKDPWGRSIAWRKLSPERLVPYLDDPRPAVRDRAVAELAKLGSKARDVVANALETGSPLARLNLVWVMCRSRELRALQGLLARDERPDVLVAALHTVGLHHDGAAVEPVERLLGHRDPAVRRQAATALGRFGKNRSVPRLLAACAAPNDRYLEHALVYSLIHIADGKATAVALRDRHADVQRCAMIALDRMEAAELDRQAIQPLVATRDAKLEMAVLEIASRRGWGAPAAMLLRRWFEASSISEQRLALASQSLVELCAMREIQDLMAAALEIPQVARPVKLMVLQAMGDVRLGVLPEQWIAALVHLFSRVDEELAFAAVTTLSALQTRAADEPLAELARDDKRSSRLRVAAAAVVGPHMAALDGRLFDLLLSQCAVDIEPIGRIAAARALANCKLSAAQVKRLLPRIAGAGPLELAPLLRPFEHGTDAATGTALVDALSSAPGLSSLDAAQLEAVLAHYPNKVRQRATPIFAELNLGVQAKAQRLAELAAALDGGNVARGRDVFFGKRGACSACHRVGDSGEVIGPNLTQIGQIRSKRDLLEAVVFPSASFARGFESVTIETAEGKVLSGIISRELAEAVYLRTSDRAEIRVARGEVEDMTPSKTSIMPQGLDKSLSLDELRNLLAFLASLRETAARN